MPDVIMVDKNLVKGLVEMLKKLSVQGGYSEWKTFIGVIEVLDQMANAPAPKEEETVEETENG